MRCASPETETRFFTQKSKGARSWGREKVEQEERGALLFSFAAQMKESEEKAKGISLAPQMAGWLTGGGEGAATARGPFPSFGQARAHKDSGGCAHCAAASISSLQDRVTPLLHIVIKNQDGLKIVEAPGLVRSTDAVISTTELIERHQLPNLSPSKEGLLLNVQHISVAQNVTYLNTVDAGGR